jgi:glycosyltransferase involved in cell wall biosynthesis
MRILAWCESLRLPTGNGILARYILPYIASLGYEVYYLNWRSLGQPCTVEYNFFGQKVKVKELPSFDVTKPDSKAFHYWFKRTLPDLVFTIGDPQYYTCLFGNDVWLPYLSVDSAPLSQHRDKVQLIPMPVVYTQFARRQLASVGVPSEVIEHGYDESIFQPLTKEERAKLKRKFGLQDKFVVGALGQNQYRKRWDLWYEAFRKIKSLVPNAFGLVHVPLEGYYQLLDLQSLFKVEDSIMYPEEDVLRLTRIPYKKMRYVYGLMDVLLHTSAAGAWELPLTEAQAVGTPSVAVDYAGMSETSRIKVKPERFEVYGNSSTFYAIADTSGMAEKVFEIHNSWDSHSENSVKFVRGLTWRNILPKWKPILESRLSDLDGTKEEILNRLRKKFANDPF